MIIKCDGNSYSFIVPISVKISLFLSLPRAVGDFYGGALTVSASTSRGRAVTRPGATQTGAHTIHTIIIVAGLPWRPGSEATIGGLVPQLEKNISRDSREIRSANVCQPSNTMTAWII